VETEVWRKKKLRSCRRGNCGHKGEETEVIRERKLRS